MRILAAALVLAGLSSLLPSPAGAQSQEEVDRARAEATVAQSTLDLAAVELVGAQFREAALEGGLLAALNAFETTNAELATTGFEAAALYDTVDLLGAEVTTLRTSAETAAAAAYRDAAGAKSALWLTDSAHGAAIVGSALGGHVREVEGTLADLGVRRAELGRAQAALAGRQAELLDLRAAHDEAGEQLEVALGVAAEVVITAIAQVEAADAAYRAALDRVEEEERRLAAVQGVEHWRPLVARYFPPERVGEAMQVMHCESRGNPDANNPTSDAAGLFQFLEGTWAFASANAGFQGASRYEPEANIASAAWLVGHSIRINHPRGVWGHWSCQPTL